MKGRILELLRNAGDSYISGEEIAQRLGVSRTAVWKHIQALKEDGYFRERHKPIGWKECRPFDGVAELLTKLRQAGITIAVATSKPEYFTNAILENAGLLTAVDFVGGSLFDGTRGKKHEVIAYVLEHFSISPDEAVMVGDRMYDVDGAKKCGMDCIGVSYGYAEPGELMSHGALCVADTTQELYEILTK